MGVRGKTPLPPALLQRTARPDLPLIETQPLRQTRTPGDLQVWVWAINYCNYRTTYKGLIKLYTYMYCSHVCTTNYVHNLKCTYSTHRLAFDDK